ncbi:hypothetical protein VFPPC_02885 [Pochonia chlamydosporia 170]|uniref:Uncharacterized protein n=1 Tax=Pochonia chlamydosporia 170 TaxID=1380566 RepID=A0A179FYU6_METCM|nr:hypothetical protein VFPPC_02885 [Pochonia chlamydosporia 170]OAQ70408.1 hypothetical protein VFPPC_02885 [Pochonia chlamydosporia 170]
MRTITVVYKGALLWLLQSPGELEALEAKSPRQFVTRGHEGGQHRRPFLFPNILSSATPPHCHKAKIVRNSRLTETSTAQIRGTKCTYGFVILLSAPSTCMPCGCAIDICNRRHHATPSRPQNLPAMERLRGNHIDRTSTADCCEIRPFWKLLLCSGIHISVTICELGEESHGP